MLLLYNQSRGIVKIIDENSTGKNEVDFCAGDCGAYCRSGKTVYTCKRDWMWDDDGTNLAAIYFQKLAI